MMRYRQLMAQAESQWQLHPKFAVKGVSKRVFSSGAAWMAMQLNALRGSDRPFNPAIRYGLYGWLKYLTCMLAFLLAALALARLHPLLMPLAVVVFYFVEVHLVVLFPLLTDGAPDPLRQSIRQPYRMGLAGTMLTVMRIATFMIAGLFNSRHPLRAWHIGCLAVIIWYRHELGDRL